MKESEEMAAERLEHERGTMSGEEINRRNSEAEGREAEEFARRERQSKISDELANEQA